MTTRAKKLPDTVGSRIAWMRERAGWTRYRLAKESGLTPIHLTRIETAGVDLAYATACKIADALGVSVADLRS